MSQLLPNICDNTLYDSNSQKVKSAKKFTGDADQMRTRRAPRVGVPPHLRNRLFLAWRGQSVRSVPIHPYARRAHTHTLTTHIDIDRESHSYQTNSHTH